MYSRAVPNYPERCISRAVCPPITPGPLPPVGPYPQYPCAVISNTEKHRYDRAFITVESYLELLTLQDADLHDGKLVRVQHLESGEAGFVIWDAQEKSWKPFYFSDAVLSITDEEIDEICVI